MDSADAPRRGARRFGLRSMHRAERGTLRYGRGVKPDAQVAGFYRCFRGVSMRAAARGWDAPAERGFCDA
ncbi:hypothetical protein D7X33_14240 [Butyricicoccus sp. 1XD8-22]|nr:hypothetical protein D7X33_14240 [Butyricicoccus sp. 1XD8-22]